MRAAHQFNVRSEIPEPLAALPRLAANLRWAWDHEIAAVFDQLDPHGRRGRHPSAVVRSVGAARWHELLADDEFVFRVQSAAQRLDHVLSTPTWFDDRREAGSPLRSVAYFSPEFGITEELAQYSGGLGVLAGDHLKASSDLGMPLVGVGLLYAEGYFHQQLNADGWQEERNLRIDPDGLGLADTGVVVGVRLAGTPVVVKVWRVDVGRIPLFLLDTNLPDNPPDAIAITNRLYGGDEQHRLRQEIVLGIGGVRALRALDIDPQVFHMNEGHAGFLGLERVREWTDRGLSFDEAIEAVRSGAVFTTHTPVPAGIDRFPRDLFERYFRGFADDLGVPFDDLFALGARLDEPDGRFNMAVMGIRLAAHRNGVAALHGAVARRMFSGMWPDLPPEETPIGHVTNGVHARTWVSDGVDRLLTEAMGDEWHLATADQWSQVRHLDHGAIWSTRSSGRQELVDLVRSRLGPDLLDPGVLTIGFARRFATYKRATLLLSQPDRLRRLLLDADRPLQFVFAGKAHPADHPGKSLIQQLHSFTRDPELRHRFVFVPDYDIGIARTMYHGCDIWLNTPRRPMEACGTSGMKAALNGVLNCSIRDGWWDEMSNGLNGWDIPSFDDDGIDDAERDRREANATFELLEREIGPLFHERGDDGLPHRWIERMKENWASLGWNVTAGRMVREYTTDLYEPAARASDEGTRDDAAIACDLAAWRKRVEAAWPMVAVTVDVAASDLDDGLAGGPRTVVASLDRGTLEADDLVVQLVHGPIGTDGRLDVSRCAYVPMPIDDDGRGTAEFVPAGSGRWGMTVRALPSHPALTSPVETGLVALG